MSRLSRRTSRPRTRVRARSISGATRKLALCWETMPTSFDCGTAFCQTGNAPFDPQNEFTAKNLLYTAHSIDEIASMTGRTPEAVAAALDRGRAALLAARAGRPRPQLDDKVLTAWNGLMIAAFARAGRVLEGRGQYVADAQRAALFVREHLWNTGESRLLRRYRQGDAGVDAYAEDYAYLGFGLLELFQADGDPAWLDWALVLQRRLDDLFWDPVEGGLVQHDRGRPVGAPAAQGGVRRRRTVSQFSGRSQSPHVVASDRRSRNGGQDRTHVRDVLRERVAAGTHRADDAGCALDVSCRNAAGGHRRRADGRRYAGSHGSRQPALHSKRRVVPVHEMHRRELSRLLPWTEELRMRDGRATAYVCRDFTCQAPVSTPEDLARQMEGL